MSGQQHAPAALYPRERPGTHLTGGWLGPGPVWTGRKSLPHRDSIPDRQAHSQSELPGTLIAKIFLSNKPYLRDRIKYLLYLTKITFIFFDQYINIKKKCIPSKPKSFPELTLLRCITFTFKHIIILLKLDVSQRLNPSIQRERLCRWPEPPAEVFKKPYCTSTFTIFSPYAPKSHPRRMHVSLAILYFQKPLRHVSLYCSQRNKTNDNPEHR